MIGAENIRMVRTFRREVLQSIRRESIRRESIRRAITVGVPCASRTASITCQALL